MKGKDLKAWRKSAGLSRSQVAISLGVSARTIEAWEQDKAPITERAKSQIDTMQQTVDVLKIPLDEELRAKLHELRKRKNIDPATWATEVLKKIL